MVTHYLEPSFNHMHHVKPLNCDKRRFRLVIFQPHLFIIRGDKSIAGDVFPFGDGDQQLQNKYKVQVYLQIHQNGLQRLSYLWRSRSSRCPEGEPDETDRRVQHSLSTHISEMIWEGIWTSKPAICNSPCITGLLARTIKKQRLSS